MSGKAASWIAAVSAATLLTGAAWAQGARTSAQSWSGCYLGAQLGGGWGSSDIVSRDGVFIFLAGDKIGDHNLSGFAGGFQGGCDVQAAQWVYGLQGSYAWSDISGSTITSNPNFSLGTSIEKLATVTGRVGYLFQWVISFSRCRCSM